MYGRGFGKYLAFLWSLLTVAHCFPGGDGISDQRNQESLHLGHHGAFLAMDWAVPQGHESYFVLFLSYLGLCFSSNRSEISQTWDSEQMVSC